MDKSLRKASHFLFTVKDEADFSAQILALFPDVAFIDDMFWNTSDPPAKSTIPDCESKWVYVWNKQIYPVLPSELRHDGRYHGPQAGLVHQIQRPHIEGDILYSGYFTMGVSVQQPEDADMIDFSKKVWKIFRKLGERRATQIDRTTGRSMSVRTDIIVAPDAYSWALADPKRFFMFNNSPFIFMRPAAADGSPC